MKRVFHVPGMQRRALTVVLVILAAFSVASAIFSVSARWQTPLILLALIAIITMLNPVEEIHTDVRYLRRVHATSAPSRTFPTRQEFYEDLSRAVNQATETLDVTHIRDDPPAAFGPEAEDYAELVTAWLAQDPNRSARRIISVRSEAMLLWAQDLVKAQQKFPRYHVRVVDWFISAPALNMAIVDKQAVFLALTGDTADRTKGFAIEDERTAEYFAAYYSVLWHAGTDLTEYLAKQVSG